MNTIRLLLVDDHEVIREGLRALLATEPTIEVVGEANNGRNAIKLAHELNPDVVLLDLMMPEMDGIETARQLQDMRVLILSNFVDAKRVREALQCGVKGYVLKDVLKDELVLAIQNVAQGKPYLHAEVQRHLMDDFQTQAPVQVEPVEALTAREQDVLKLIARGLSNKEIGASLNLTEGTVKGYVSSVLLKLNVADRTQAALYAVKTGVN